MTHFYSAQRNFFGFLKKIKLTRLAIWIKEGVYVAIGNQDFCLFLYLTGVHFLGESQHGGDVSQQKIKCRPIRTREIGGILLSDALYVRGQFN